MNESSVDQAMQDYEARRCHICGARYPSFGFGPPMLKPEHALWACREHWDEVGHIAQGGQSALPPNRKPRLL